MSILRYMYRNGFDDSTVALYSSQLDGLPVSNVQGEILAKKWRTESGFAIKTGYNDIFEFAYTATTSMAFLTSSFAVASGTYTGSGLATVVQTGLNTVSVYGSHTCSYNSGTYRFTIAKGGSGTTFELKFGDNPNRSLATIMGFDKDSTYSGTTSYLSPHPTQGNQHFANFSATTAFSSSVFILDNNNMSSGTVFNLRVASTSTHFSDLYTWGFGDGIFQSTVNLATDPEDLTTGNWTKTNCTAVLSDIYYDGKRFTKVINSGAASGYVGQTLSDLWVGSFNPSFSVIIKKGNTVDNRAQFVIRNVGTGSNILNLIVDFDNYPNDPTDTIVQGTLHGWNWKDSETLEIRCICDDLTLWADDLSIRCFASPNATAGEYTYWTAVQVEDLPYPTPYVNGSRADVNINETFQLPPSGKFTIDIMLEPWFVYDTSIYHRFIVWYVDSTHRFLIWYNSVGDFIEIAWQDGGTVRYLNSQQFDDGSSYTDINQRLRILASMDLATGDINGSRLIVIPQEVGAIFEGDTFSGTPDILASTFSTLSIGHESSANHADSQYEYLRVYAGTLVGTVADNDDADALLAAKTLLFDKNYKNTGYMRYLATSTTFGFYERQLTINESKKVVELTSTVIGKAIQVNWWDGDNEYSEIGRLWLGDYFEPNYHQTNTISYQDKIQDFRSKQFLSEAGVAFFDKRDDLLGYAIPVDPLDEYYDNATKTGIEDMLNNIRNDKCIYITLDASNLNGSTVYVYHVGKKIAYNRVKNTPTFNLKSLVFREQK